MDYEMEELVPIVGDLVRLYTSNESTSVSYEKAQQLMEAILFCIEEGERAADSQFKDREEEVLVKVAKHPHPTAREAYEHGYQCVLRKTKEALLLYHRIMESFCSYRNIALADTIVKGMPEFFRHYDAGFAPQNQILTLDYPTLIGVEQEKGIDAIYQYLKYVELEQRFLAGFPEEYVEECLEGYHEEHEELLINLPGIVLRETIRRMQGREEEWNVEGGREELEQWLVGNLRILVRDRYAGDEKMFEYLRRECTEWSYWIRQK